MINNLLAICFVLLVGCTIPTTNKQVTVPIPKTLPEVYKQLYTTNYLGVFRGFIAIRKDATGSYDMLKNRMRTQNLTDSVLLYSASTGRLYNWITYEEFEIDYILGNK